MTPEQRAKLEGRAKSYGFTSSEHAAFNTGVIEAWEMATQAERERCAELVYRNDVPGSLYAAILYPPTPEPER